MIDNSVVCKKNKNKTPQSGEAPPVISVLLPVYNAAPYLHAALDSVLAQTFGNFELLALDDGSTDNSLDVLKEFTTKDNRVRIITRENKGLIATLNELISEAKGKYLARMDADDICLPQRFEKQVAFMETHPDNVVVGSWVETINAKSQPIGIIKHPLHHKDIDRNNLIGHTSIWHPAAMICGKAAIAIGGYRPEFKNAEDIDLWLRLAEIGRLSNIPEILLQYRLHENSISESTGKAQQSKAKHACEQAWQRRNIQRQYKSGEHWRPGTDKASRHKFALRYGWVSWNNKHRATWWTYVCLALRLKPFSFSSWNLLVFGLLKSPKPRERSE